MLTVSGSVAGAGFGMLGPVAAPAFFVDEMVEKRMDNNLLFDPIMGIPYAEGSARLVRFPRVRVRRLTLTVDGCDDISTTIWVMTRHSYTRCIKKQISRTSTSNFVLVSDPFKFTVAPNFKSARRFVNKVQGEHAAHL